MQAYLPGKWRILTVPAGLKTASFAMQSNEQFILRLQRFGPVRAMPN
jgi:hypothetical protein